MSINFETKENEIKKLYYSYEELTNDLHKIVNQIDNSKWNPDLIIGPCRGAYIPGVMLSHKYNKPFYGFTWQTRDGNKKDYEELFNILKNNKDKNILMIDDINDSGLTMNGIYDTIKLFKMNENETNGTIKYCVLFNKIQSTFNHIDYYAKQLTPENNPWVVFPYEEW